MTKKRIGYIDALKGFTILLVVAFHFSKGAHISGNFCLHEFLSLFRMPLFFLISGFILYKDNFVWNLSNSYSFIVKKFRVQIITTLIIICVYSLFSQLSIYNILFAQYKEGYWFTISLFMFFVLYTVLMFIFGRKNNNLALLIGGVIGFILYRYRLREDYCDWGRLFNLMSVDTLKYFVYFISGAILRKYFDFFQCFMRSDYFISIIIFLFFFFCYIILNDIRFPKIGYVKLLTSLMGAVITFCFFYKNEKFFMADNCVARSLKYVGRRTLDVYFLHYFFIPQNIGALGNVFDNDSSMVFCFLYTLILAIVIVGFCLLISSVLRLSPFIAKWMFGASKSNI